MKQTNSASASLQKACFRVTAQVTSRLMQRNTADELARLEALPTARSYLEVAGILSVLFALSIIAAGIGWWALGLYFAAVIFLFH
jgi:hypothetical protein